MTVRVERYAGGSAEWDGFAEKQHGFTHCHRLGWRTVVENVFGHECVYLSARDAGGSLSGVLPMVRVKSHVFGHFLVSMPFLNYGGPLGEAHAVRALVDEAAVLAREERVDLLELRSRSEVPAGLAVSHRKITVVLDLPRSPDELFRQFTGKLRSQIRRPQKEGVSVAFGVDQLEKFYRVFAHHMRDLGTPTQSLRFFRAIADAFPDDVWFACAYLDGQPIAGGCGFRCGPEFEMTWASALRAFNRVSPNMLLYWSMMERAIEEGLSVFNFGRCTPGGGTHRFKAQWGGRDEALWWYGLSRRAKASTPSPHDGAFSWGPRIWRMLPAQVATALGPHIVRYIP